MDVYDLDVEMENAVDGYKNKVQHELKQFKEMSTEEREVYLPEILEEMHRSNFYALLGMKDELIEYIKYNE